MTESLHRLGYCSRNAITARGHDIEQEITGILAISRFNNSRDGITGALLFGGGCFAQVLEGPLPAIEQAFERIQCDIRHDHVIALAIEPVAERAFLHWSMAYAGNVGTAAAPVLARITGAAARKDGSGRDGAGEELLAMLCGLVHPVADWAAAG